MPTPRGPFVPIPNTCKVEIVGHDVGDNKPIVCVMHALCPGSPTPTNISDIASVFEAWLATVSAETSGEASWDFVRATDLNTSTGPQEVVATSHGGSGGDAPPGLSAVVELVTALRGRSHTGRTFWPVNWTRVTLADGTISTAGVAALANDFNTLRTNLVALSPASQLVVASRKLATSTQTTGVIVRPEIGRIRRRAFG